MNIRALIFCFFLSLTSGAVFAQPISGNCQYPSSPCAASTFTASQQEITPLVKTHDLIALPDAGALCFEWPDGGAQGCVGSFGTYGGNFLCATEVFGDRAQLAHCGYGDSYPDGGQITEAYLGSGALYSAGQVGFGFQTSSYPDSGAVPWEFQNQGNAFTDANLWMCLESPGNPATSCQAGVYGGGSIKTAATMQAGAMQAHDFVNLPDAGGVMFMREDGGQAFYVSNTNSATVSTFECVQGSTTPFATALTTGACSTALNAQGIGSTAITNNGLSLRMIAPASTFFIRNSGFPDAGFDAFAFRNEVAWADNAVILGVRNGSSTVDKMQVLGDGTVRQQSTGTFSGPVTALKSATTSVDVSAATAPSSGQVLTATSSTAATWQTPSGGNTVEVPIQTTWPSVVTAGPVNANSVIIQNTLTEHHIIRSVIQAGSGPGNWTECLYETDISFCTNGAVNTYLCADAAGTTTVSSVGNGLTSGHRYAIRVDTSGCLTAPVVAITHDLY